MEPHVDENDMPGLFLSLPPFQKPLVNPQSCGGGPRHFVVHVSVFCQCVVPFIVVCSLPFFSGHGMFYQKAISILRLTKEKYTWISGSKSFFSFFSKNTAKNGRLEATLFRYHISLSKIEKSAVVFLIFPKKQRSFVKTIARLKKWIYKYTHIFHRNHSVEF